MLRDPDNQRLLNGTGEQHDRGHVLRFLHAGVEATNNRAERDDLGRNAGWVSVGVDHDTAEFAVESILRWQ